VFDSASLTVLNIREEILVTYDANAQLQTMIDNLPEKTGKSLSDWFKVIVPAKCRGGTTGGS
jgi:hypothetical protein